ncbi:MAG: DUF3467 domain-containing protein [Planctomycetota bacterium]
MSTETADQPQAQQQQMQVRIDQSKMETGYANTVRTSTTADEIVLDFGLNIPQQTREGQPVMNFEVGNRIVLNWSTAKRLLGTLHQAVSAYEAHFGEIPTGPKQPINPPQQG